MIRLLIRPLLRLICGTLFLKHKRGKQISIGSGPGLPTGTSYSVTYECPRCKATHTRKKRVK